MGVLFISDTSLLPTVALHGARRHDASVRRAFDRDGGLVIKASTEREREGGGGGGVSVFPARVLPVIQRKVL